MKEVKIADTYAKSLLLEAERRKCASTVAVDMGTLGACLLGSEEFQSLVKSRVIDHHKKETVWCAIAQKLKAFHPLTVEFVSMLIRQRRESLLQGMIASYQRQYRLTLGIEEMEIQSVQPLDKRELDYIQKKVIQLKKTKVELTNTLNPTLIDGFILKTKEGMVDLSIKGRLQLLKQRWTSAYHSSN